MLLDGPFKTGWVKGAEVEARKSDCQSFVQQQRQPEWTSTRSRPDLGNVLSYCPSHAGFRVGRQLYEELIVFKLKGFRFTVGIGSVVICFRFLD